MNLDEFTWQVVFLVAAALLSPYLWSGAQRLWRGAARLIRAYSAFRGSSESFRLTTRLLAARFRARGARTPDQFKAEYKAYHALIGAATEGADTESLAMSFLQYHKEEADYLWPFDDRARAYRTAYHYRLAYQAAERAGSWREAATLAHFAGHRFRALGEYQQAADDYIRSAQLHGKRQKGDNGRKKASERSARRAMGCLLAVAEFEKVEGVGKQFGLRVESRDSGLPKCPDGFG